MSHSMIDTPHGVDFSFLVAWAGVCVDVLSHMGCREQQVDKTQGQCSSVCIKMPSRSSLLMK